MRKMKTVNLVWTLLNIITFYSYQNKIHKLNALKQEKIYFPMVLVARNQDATRAILGVYPRGESPPLSVCLFLVVVGG